MYKLILKKKITKYKIIIMIQKHLKINNNKSLNIDIKISKIKTTICKYMANL